MKFLSKIIDAEGREKKVVIDAANKAEVYGIVKEKGDTLVDVEEADSFSKHSVMQMDLSSLFKHVSAQEKIAFAKNLGSMLDAGLALSRALGVIEKQTKKQYFKAVMGKLNLSISKGQTLADSLKEYPNIFSTLVVSMVKAGEESGSLSQSLRLVSVEMDNTYKLTRKIRGAMMYPSVIIVAMLGVGFFMLTNVVPILSKTFKDAGVPLPMSTQIVIGLSDFLQANLILSISTIVLAVLLLYFGARTAKGRRFQDYLFLHIPVINGLVKETNVARMTRTLSSLLSAGVNFVSATQITRDVIQNSYYKEVMDVIAQKVQKGELVAGVFSERERLFPAFVGEMVSVGEETGQITQMLMGVAVFYEEDVDQRTKDMSTIIEPFLMILMGVAVGFFALSMITPIYSLGNSIK